VRISVSWLKANLSETMTRLSRDPDRTCSARAPPRQWSWPVRAWAPRPSRASFALAFTDVRVAGPDHRRQTPTGTHKDQVM